MRNYFILLFLIGGLAFGQKSVKTNLNSAIKEMNELESIAYVFEEKKVNKAIDLDEEKSTQCYIDFTAENSLIGARYHYVHDNGEHVFNGVQEFKSYTDQKEVNFTNTPNVKNLYSGYSRFSYLELRKSLPLLVNNSNCKINQIEDIVVGDEDCYKYQLLLKDYWIAPGGGLYETKGYTCEYYIAISKEDYLPRQFIYKMPKQGVNIVSFKKLNRKPVRSKKIWELKRFEKDYKIETYEVYYSRLEEIEKSKVIIGNKAPAWSLVDLGGKKVSLSEFSGNLTLLVFWFNGCPPCKQAIPGLNTLKESYASKGLKVLGIHYWDKIKDKTIQNYVRENDIQYSILHKGEAVAKSYGVWAAPTFFLINRKGEVVYKNQGFDKKKLEAIIKEQL